MSGRMTVLMLVRQGVQLVAGDAEIGHQIINRSGFASARANVFGPSDQSVGVLKVIETGGDQLTCLTTCSHSGIHADRRGRFVQAACEQRAP